MKGKIAILSPNPSVERGGVERFCSLLARALAADGWSVDVVGRTDLVPSKWVRRTGLGFLWAGTQASRTVPEADVLITNGFLRSRPSIRGSRVHVFHGAMAPMAWALRHERRFDVFLQELVGGGSAEVLAARGAFTVAVSERVSDEVAKWYRRRPNRVVTNGVDLDIFFPRDRRLARDRFGLTGGQPVALFAGRPEVGKGFADAIEACKAAGWRLLVAGTDAAPEPAVGLGWLAPEELAYAYSAADAFVLPTRWEGCSYAILEAMACGTPVVTSSTGWMSTLVDAVPEYGAMIALDVPAISAVLRRLEGQGVDESVADAQRFVKEHNSFERFATNWQQIVSEVSGNGTSRGS